MAAMTRFKVLFTVALASFIITSSANEPPKPSYARTILKVARSLPGETEEVKVRTSEGNMATLLVKRRDNKSGPYSDFQNGRNRKPPIEIGQRVHPNGGDNVAQNNSNGRFDTQSYERQREDNRRQEEAQVERIRTLFGTTMEPYLNWKPLETVETAERRYDSQNLRQHGLVVDNRGERNLPFENMNPTRILENRAAQMAPLSHQQRPLMRTNIGANLYKNRDAKNVPPEVVVRSEINVKSMPKRSPMTLDADGTPIIHGKRVPDDPMDKIQTWRKARVINNQLVPEGATTVTIAAPTNFYSAENMNERRSFDNFFSNVNRRYGRNFDGEERNVYFEWDPKNYRNDGLKAEVYETKDEKYDSNVQKRMLQPETITSYPNSQTYTPESQKIAPVALKSSGVRTPVLQYAHPELGVQPAKIVKNEKKKPENFPDNQFSFTETRQKKKYVLNDKNLVDSYTTKNYYPNQHFYGLKPQNEAPFWVKISENLKNQFSTGVEKVSQYTRPVFDPLVEATQKISQNLGLSKVEAQNKVGTVATGSSILIPALGLVASGAALGIGAVAVGRYLDVEVLKRSNEEDFDLEHKRAMESSSKFAEDTGDRQGYSRSLEAAMGKIAGSREEDDGVFLVLEEADDSGKVENRETKPVVDEDYIETNQRHRRSLDHLDVFKAETDMRNLVRNKRLQRKGPDYIEDLVEIDVPESGDIDIAEFLGAKTEDSGLKKEEMIVVVEDNSKPLKMLENEPQMKIDDEDAVKNIAKIVGNLMKRSEEMKTFGSRSKRSVESDQELDDEFQNLENAEVAEVAHIEGDWTNTPCAKRIFCDAMIQRGPDAAIFMEKKMASLLGLIQPGAAIQVSSHFEEVMDAVRRHDCSNFLCPQARPGNVFL